MKIFLLISQIFYLICIVFWIPIFGLSFMSFDAGFNLYNVTFAFTIGFYPIAVIVCSIIAWIFRLRKKRVAIIINLIPMLWILPIGLSILYFL
ncbi:hypothetical protein ACIQ4I_12670 [Rummeliibacillus sp. NPDC094406]|uniref:hypothetical protein n=1 Tax=Rummeliibacillus sp. NPDC094406 TaxID=3364511 RepID=UPI0037F1C0A0